MHHEMPVTTKAQLSAETQDGKQLKTRMREFLSKIKKSAKIRVIPNGSHPPTCGLAFKVSEPYEDSTPQQGLPRQSSKPPSVQPTI
jgi:hypothetical protein